MAPSCAVGPSQRLLGPPERSWGVIYLTRDTAVSHGYMETIEAAARRAARIAYLRQNQGRLFRVGDMELESERTWEVLNDRYWGKPVAVVSFDSDPVGIYHGIGPDFLGPALTVTHFGSPGCSSHVSPLSIGYILELPRQPYGWIVDMIHKGREEDDY